MGSLIFISTGVPHFHGVPFVYSILGNFQFSTCETFTLELITICKFAVQNYWW